MILLIVAAAIILPMVFKDEIIARAKDEINKNLTAQVDFEDIDISLFRSFPDFSLTIENTTVDGQGTFEGVRLAEVEDFTVDLNLFSVISGNQYEVERIWISDANVHVVIDTAGNANYDIMKASEDTATVDTAASSDFQLTLEEYGLENFNLIYDDREGEIYARLQNLNHSGTGDFSEEIVDLSTETTIEALTVKYGGMAYLDHVDADLDADFEFNQPEFKITFRENQLSLNNLLLNFSGFVAMPEEDITMDLAFEAPENQFKSILSLVPAVYQESFADVETSGDFALKGSVSGTYNGEQETYPQYDIKFNINEASFQYPDLPAGVENIAVDAHIYNKTSDLDGTVVNVPTARATVAGSPVMARLNLSKPMSNPTFEAFLETNMDLSDIGRVVPSDDFDYSGQVMANLDLAGNMADIENERYENVKAEGAITASNVVLQSDSLPYNVRVDELDMQFSPQNVALNAFNSQLGQSDISANGTINNILAYALKDEALNADFSLTSNLIDLNELMGAVEEEGEAEEEVETDTTGSMEIIRIPDNLDVRLTADVQRLLYDNLEIEGVNGVVTVQNGTASLENLMMDLLGGSLALSGSYNSTPPLPMVDMNFKINNFGFKESYDKLVSIRQLAPIMKYSSGTYSTGFSFSSKLNSDMTPEYSTVEASGSLNTQNLETSPQSLEKVASALNNPSLKTLNIGDVSLDFTINDGRVEVEPFDFSAANVDATVFGTMGLDQTLDYTMSLDIPVSGINANDLLEKIGATQGGMAEVQILIGGTFSNPTVTTSLGDIVGNVVDNLKEKAREKVEEVKDDAVEKVNEKAQQLIDEAEQRGDELISQAQAQADKIVSEAESAAQKLRSEADNRASQLEDEAKGNILKEQGAKVAAKKIRDEADDKAQQLINEAEKRAQSLVDKAREQKEQLVKQARDKGQVQ